MGLPFKGRLSWGGTGHVADNEWTVRWGNIPQRKGKGGIPTWPG
jgi:hypothetical protein